MKTTIAEVVLEDFNRFIAKFTTEAREGLEIYDPELLPFYPVFIDMIVKYKMGKYAKGN